MQNSNSQELSSSITVPETTLGGPVGVYGVKRPLLQLLHDAKAKGLEGEEVLEWMDTQQQWVLPI